MRGRSIVLTPATFARLEALVDELAEAAPARHWTPRGAVAFLVDRFGAHAAAEAATLDVPGPEVRAA